VLLDLHMPVLDGSGLAKAIREEEARRGLPPTALIAVTADALKGVDASCFAAGMDGFLSKPISIDALRKALGRWLPDIAPAEDADVELFDSSVLQGLFGGDRRRLAALVQSFADSAARDIAALQAAPAAGRLVASAHRLKGAARMAGALRLAGEAAGIERATKAGDLAFAQEAAGRLAALLDETLRAMRSVL
jgi:HPt (histidine-containing phosphotransfer) domain-containing protein